LVLAVSLSVIFKDADGCSTQPIIDFGSLERTSDAKAKLT
jgi:hypothetical protein